MMTELRVEELRPRNEDDQIGLDRASCVAVWSGGFIRSVALGSTGCGCCFGGDGTDGGLVAWGYREGKGVRYAAAREAERAPSLQAVAGDGKGGRCVGGVGGTSGTFDSFFVLHLTYAALSSFTRMAGSTTSRASGTRR